MTWIQTYSGVAFDLEHPRPEMVVLEDIAVALSRIPRFNGHTQGGSYSVAQHSIGVSHLVPPEHAKWGLMHDAAEAYAGDMTSPVKWMIGQPYRDLESRILCAVAERFDLPFHGSTVDDSQHIYPGAVEHADLVMLATEKRDLMGPEPQPWVDLPEPRERNIEPLSANGARIAFMMQAGILGIS